MEKIYEIISKVLDVDKTILNENSGPGNTEGWDSLAMINIISAIEEDFNFTFELDDMVTINSLKDIFNVVKKNKSTGFETEPQEKNNEIDLNSFRKPEILYSGSKSFNNIEKYITNKTLIVVGSGDYTTNIIKLLVPILDKLHLTENDIILKKEDGEPDEKKIRKLISKIDFEPDTIIGIGGGSVLDTCKLVYILINNPKSDLENWIKPFSLPEPNENIKLISVPTTHGTGSEVSSSAIFSNLNKGKTVILSHQFISEVVIHDPLLIQNLPKNVIIDSSIDAFTHAIEGYLSKIENSNIYPLVIESLSIILKYLNNSIKSYDNSSISALLRASYLAGIIQNHCSVGLCHSLSHQLSRFGLSHGRLNAIFLPKVIEFNYANDKKKLDELAHDLNLSSGKDIINWLNEFNMNNNIKGFSENYQFSNDDEIYELCKEIKSDITYATTPFKISDDNLKNMLVK